MHMSKNDPSAMLRLFAFAFLGPATAVASAAQLSSGEMKTVEKFGPVENTGRFMYFDHQFQTNSPTVFICELDGARTGGSFLPLRFVANESTVCGDRIDASYPFDWYRIRRRDDSVDLAVLWAKRFGDGDDLRGFVQPRPVSVFTFDGGAVRRTTPYDSFAGLLLDPEFKSLEPVDVWRRAHRREDGRWEDEESRSPKIPVHDKVLTEADRQDLMPTEADRSRLVALRKKLLEHFDSEIPEAAMFVFDRGPENDIDRAFVADSAHPFPDGTFLWTSFQWSAPDWTEVPPEGSRCPSGKVPNVFPLSTSGFFVLSYLNEAPRLVTLRSSPDGPVEPFWQAALADPKIVEETRRFGIPNKSEPPDLWWNVSMPPHSIAQAIYDLGRTRRLVRAPVLALNVVAPFWNGQQIDIERAPESFR